MPRIIAITGAFGVLGSAVAEAAVRQGDSVALIDFAPASPRIGATTPDRLVLGGVDLVDPASAAKAMAAIEAHFGGLDALLNIAGGFKWEMLEGGDPESWAAMHRMNVVTCANACRAALSLLKRSAAGRIVNVGANAAIKAAAGMGAYTAAKAGVHRLTEALAEELKSTSIKVNAVLPSILDTPTNRADMPDADASAWVAPAALAKVMLFLASEDAGVINGALLPVVGGV